MVAIDAVQVVYRILRAVLLRGKLPIALTHKKSHITQQDVIDVLFGNPAFLNLIIRDPRLSALILR